GTLDDEGLLDVRQIAVGIGEVALFAQRGHGAHGVEEVGQHEGEHQETGGEDTHAGECTDEIECTDQGQVGNTTEGVGDARNRKRPTLRVGFAVLEGGSRTEDRLGDDGNDGGTQDADEQATANTTDDEDAAQQDTDDEHEGGPGGD